MLKRTQTRLERLADRQDKINIKNRIGGVGNGEERWDSMSYFSVVTELDKHSECRKTILIMEHS